MPIRSTRHITENTGSTGNTERTQGPQSTRSDQDSAWKDILKLHERRHGRRYIMDLLRFLDWLLRLPRELEEEVARETEGLGEAKHMPYITSWERMGMEKGMDKGLEIGREEGLAKGLLEAIASGLEIRFGAEGRKLLPRARKVKDIARLRRLRDALFTAESIQEVKRILPRR
jgi:hypothetical protein